jgi:hypothetical protein
MANDGRADNTAVVSQAPSDGKKGGPPARYTFVDLDRKEFEGRGSRTYFKNSIYTY